MAGNQVLLTFAGDANDLNRTFRDVGSGADRMGREVGSSFDRIGESADSADTSAMGLADGMNGLHDFMKRGEQDFDSWADQGAYFAMIASDMGSSLYNSVIPALKGAVGWIRTFSLTMVVENAKAVASNAAAVASTVAGWVLMGVQAMVNAAKMAAAWLISLGPIGLVIAAVGGVVAILAAMGVGFDDVANVAQGAWEFITNAASTAKDWLAENWPLVLAILTGPFGLAVLAIARHRDSILTFMRGIPGAVTGFFSGLAGIITAPFSAAFSAVKSAWNNTVGGFGFSTPSWLPGLGNKSFRIPEMHTGGIVPGAPGSETLALLQAGERVIPANQSGGPTVVINVSGSVLSERDLVKVVRDELTRGGFRGAF